MGWLGGIRNRLFGNNNSVHSAVEEANKRGGSDYFRVRRNICECIFPDIEADHTRPRIGAVHTCPPSPITNADFSSNEATCGHVCATILAKRNQASWPLCAGHNTHRVTYHSFSTTRENSAFLQSTVLHLSILSLNRTWRLDLAHGFAHGLAIANRS